MTAPNFFTRYDTSGMIASETRVSSQLIAAMKPSAPIVMSAVSAGYMMPGPSTMRTAEMSFAARDIKSPVRQR